MATPLTVKTVEHLIVGAGPIGILHGIKLKKDQQPVLVVERNEKIGGRWKCLVQHDAVFENGLHFVHHTPRWNEFLFDINEEIPLSAPTENPLLYEGKKWKGIDNLDAFSATEQRYLQPGLSMVAGGMAPWLQRLVEKHQLEVLYQSPIRRFEISENGIERARTPKDMLEAKNWFLTGSPTHYQELLSPQLLSKHSCSTSYEPAFIFQFLLRQPVSDSHSVHVLRHKMDHTQHHFLGLFESNLDPRRAPEGRQTSTWMCFMTPEEFEDPSAVTRWRRALRRSLTHHWEDWDRYVLWERFLALPQAGGPQPRTKTLPAKIPQGKTAQWHNCHFLTHSTAHQEEPFFWTTQQLLSSERANIKRSETVAATEQPQA